MQFETNISIKKPYSDTCGTCDEHKISISQEKNAKKRNLLETAQTRHLDEVEFLRIQLKESKEKSSFNNPVIVFDLMKISGLLKLSTQQAYY